MTDAEIVRKAADLMETHGWVDGVRHTPDGRMCVLGAFELAMGSTFCDGHPLLEKVREALSLPLELDKHSHLATSWALADWSNAANGPTVVKALRGAAAQL